MSRTIKLLGTLEIEENGRPSKLMKSPKGCAVLSYLLVTEQAHRREVIADLLWDAVSTKRVLSNLRRLIYRMRPLVPELEVSRSQINYRPNSEIDIDLYALRKGLASLDADTLEAGLALYRGDLLTGFYVEDAPRFQEWLLVEQERLRQTVWAGYRRLCTALTEQEAWERGERVARRWLALDPLDEEVQRQLIQILVSNGQVAAALKQFNVCRELLWDELGVEPEGATVELGKQIIKLEAEVGAGFDWEAAIEAQMVWPKPDEVADVGSLPMKSHVPFHRNMAFIGRIPELLTLANHLLPNCETTAPIRSVVVHGMGGLGKTQLAVEYAYRYGRYYPGGVFWLSFANPDNIDEEIAAVGGSAGMCLFSDAEQLPLSERVAKVQQAWRESIPRLLIFDNCEDELLVVDWLPNSGGCSVLLTSRSGNWPLEMPITQLPLDVLPRAVSVALLQQMARHLSAEGAATVAHEVGDLPLALQLAGHFLARHRTVQPDAYITQLHETHTLQHASLQGRFSRYSPTGHELHVARTFALSYDQLTNNAVDVVAKRLLSQAACFAPGEPLRITLLIATIVADSEDVDVVLSAEEGLSRLIELGIVEKRGSQTIVLHRLLVMFTQSVGAGMEAAQQQVEQTLIATLENHRQQDLYLHLLPVALPHLVYIAESALPRRDARALMLSEMLGHHFVHTFNFPRAQAWLTRSLELAQDLYVADSFEVAAINHRFADLHYEMGDFKQAKLVAESVLSVYEQTRGGMSLVSAEISSLLGILCQKFNLLDQSRHYLDHAVTIYQQNLHTHQEKVALCYYRMAKLLILQGDFDAALQFGYDALHLREQQYGTENRLIADSLSVISQTLNYLGHFAEARAINERAIAIMINLVGREHPLLVVPWLSVGANCWNLGDFEAAYQYYADALHITEKHYPPDHPLTAFALHNSALGLAKMARYEQAQAYCERAWQIRRERFGEDHFQTIRTAGSLGELSLLRGAYEQAVEQLEATVPIQERIDPVPLFVSEGFVLLGRAYIGVGDLDAALPYLERAIAMRQEEFGANDKITAMARQWLGRWYEANGQYNVAREIYKQVITVFLQTVSATHPDLLEVQAWLNQLKE